MMSGLVVYKVVNNKKKQIQTSKFKPCNNTLQNMIMILTSVSLIILEFTLNILSQWVNLTSKFVYLYYLINSELGMDTISCVLTVTNVSNRLVLQDLTLIYNQWFTYTVTSNLFNAKQLAKFPFKTTVEDYIQISVEDGSSAFSGLTTVELVIEATTTKSTPKMCTHAWYLRNAFGAVE
mmetsp:Transcript_478/g.580  ORF Transcript_478/g.580 Transcript_478/m.580 type:complete len:179 (+) Transcript_478:475-1011(+)